METKVLLPDENTYKLCAREVKEGGIVAFPTETVYGLGANALRGDAVLKVFRAKGRPSDNPLIAHVWDISEIEKYAFIETECARLLIDAFMPGPFTAVLRKRDNVSAAVTCGLATVGIRIPQNDIARSFIKECGLPLAAPSANTSGRPSPTTAMHVYEDLSGRIPYIIDGGSCDIGIESTVVDVTGEIPVILREGKITLSDIIRVCGKGTLGGKSSGGQVASPGLKYRHYAPDCEVAVVSHGGIAAIKEEYSRQLSLGKTPLVLCYDGTAKALGGLKLWTIGADDFEVAKNLYEKLRRAEKECDIIILEASEGVGFGRSLNDRIKRSASK